jgi:Tfp pilus assembly protein PilF
MNTPSPIDGLWQQAQRHFSGRDHEAARAACETVLSSAPGHSGAHLMLSILCGQRDQLRLATEHAVAAAAGMRRPTLQQVAAVSARLIQSGEYEWACRILLQVDVSRVGASRFLVDMSQQLTNLGRHEDALRYLDAAIAQGYRGEAVSYLRGTYLRYLGRFEEAAAAFEHSLAVNPGLVFAHRALANLDIPAGREARIDRIRKALQRAGLTDVDRAYLGYALFRELDAIDETDAAWQALEEGSRAQRRTLDYDAGAESALLDRLIAACGPGFADGQADAGGDRTPLFILGMPRTGTTLVERILGGHPQVTLCGELNDFRQQFKWASDHQCPGFIDGVGIERLAGIDFVGLGRRYVEHVRWRVPDTGYFSDKNPGNWMLAGLILRALPQAKVVHLRRNPMDTCFSNLKELFAPRFYPYSYRLEDLAAHYRNYARVMAHWHAIAPGRILDLQYEDLVSDPAGEARRLMEYCGLGFSPDQLRVEENASPVSTASFVQVRQAIHARNVDGWKRYAAPLAPLERLLADTVS